MIKKVVITGATGYIGKQLIAKLQKADHILLLVGRDLAILEQYSSDKVKTASYDEFPEMAKDYDALVHLAARNNDQQGSLDDFRSANVGLLQNVVAGMLQARIDNLIYISSLRANASNPGSPYDISKAEAEAWLESIEQVDVKIIRLPAVYGAGFKGKLSMLDKVPELIRPPMFNILKCIKPTVHVNIVITEIINNIIRSSKPGNYETILTDRQMNNPVYNFLVRILDIVFAFFVILALWWLLAAIWMAVKFTSPGPGIFAQSRIGKDGKVFTCYKFRTMADGVKQAGTHELSASHVTRIGGILRRFKLDELPQVVNLLRNELSLVGPRPCLPVQTELVEERTRLGVLDVKPGITGWAQIKGVDMSQPKILALLDAEYISFRTFVLDIKILFFTALGRGNGDKVSSE